MAKRKEIKWRWEARGTMIGRQNGIIFRIYHPWDMPEREHTVSCYDTKGSARTISTAGYRKFTWEEAVEFCDLADKEDPGKCRLSEEQEETVAVIALLHDVCKVGCYHTETKRRKNPETGRWEDYEGYTYKDPLPLGHGEKSLYLIQRHMVLLPEEALAIRWHMGAYDDAAKADSRAMAAAMAASPWVWRLQEADMCAAWIDEREAGQ